MASFLLSILSGAVIALNSSPFSWSSFSLIQRFLHQLLILDVIGQDFTDGLGDQSQGEEEEHVPCSCR